MATWAAEKAKIALSQSEESVVSLAENELGVRDQAGEEIYLDIPSAKLYDGLIASKVDESIPATRESIEKAGLSSHDVERDRLSWAGQRSTKTCATRWPSSLASRRPPT
jgi:molecular chaperone DnaK